MTAVTHLAQLEALVQSAEHYDANIVEANSIARNLYISDIDFVAKFQAGLGWRLVDELIQILNDEIRNVLEGGVCAASFADVKFYYSVIAYLEFVKIANLDS
jgi:hypothetical protein